MNNTQICKKTPLPNKLQTRWEEVLAKLILEQCFSDHFMDLDFEKEKPDLRNITINIGIEVTSSIYRGERTLDSLFPLYMHGNQEEKQEAAQKIDSLGGKIYDGILIHPIRDNSVIPIYTCIEIKLGKLNKKDFKKFEENDLFIFGTTRIHELLFDDLKHGIETINTPLDWEYIFDNIYYYYIPGGEIIWYNRKSKEMKRISVENPDELSELAQKILCD